jgi:hypothetical protein
MPAALTAKRFSVSWSNGRYEAPALQIESRQRRRAKKVEMNVQ